MVVKEDLFEMALNVYVLMDRRCESTGKLLEGKAQGFKKHITTLQKKQNQKPLSYTVFLYCFWVQITQPLNFRKSRYIYLSSKII